jgi:putative transposase
VPAEIKNRGVADVLMMVCDGLKGVPQAIGQVWPQTVVRTCVVRLLRASFRYAARRHWDAIAEAPRPVCTAPTEAAAFERFAEFAQAWGGRYPAIVKLWEDAWAEFVPFLSLDAEIRRVICSTNAIEPVNGRIRRAVKARGHFPSEQAALKCVYMAIMSFDPTGKGRKRWMNRWRAALNAFAVTFEGRLSPASRWKKSATSHTVDWTDPRDGGGGKATRRGVHLRHRGSELGYGDVIIVSGRTDQVERFAELP